MTLKEPRFVRLPEENLKEAERILKNLERHLNEIGKKAEAIKVATITKLFQRK